MVLQLLDFLYRYVSETLQDADVRFFASLFHMKLESVQGLQVSWY